MILFYRVLTNILYPFLIIFIYFRVFLKKEDSVRYKEKILVKYFNVNKTKNLKNLLWIHAASVGELKSIVSLIKKLNNEQKFEFLITTTTLSSSNFFRLEFDKYENIQHRFIPLDISFLIEKFLHIWKPKKIFLVDSEIWPNLILKARQFKIPIALINARITKKSFKRWSMFPKVANEIFGIFELCLCSNNETKNFLEKLKAKNIRYFGNLKFIKEDNNFDFRDNNNELLLNSRFWVAASTHRGEEIMCLKTHIQLKKKYSDLITIIAPRHIDRVNEIKSLSQNFFLKTQLLGHNDKIFKENEIIIINSFGLLKNYFRNAKSVFIGKSLVEKLKNDSGQNPIDAAYLNCKIYHGPYVTNFSEIYEFLKKKNISYQVQNFEELSKYLEVDLKDKHKKKNENLSKSLQLVGQNTLSYSMKHIKNFLNDKIN